MNINCKARRPWAKTAIASLLAAGFTQGANAAPGDLLGDPVTIGSSAYVDPNGPRVASDTNGNMVATWVEYPGYGVMAQRLDAGGNALGSPIQVAALAPADYLLGAPAVAMNASGQFVIGWTEYQKSRSIGAPPAAKTNAGIIQWPVAPTLIHSRTFNADGTPVSGDIVVADMPFSPLGNDPAAVAMDDDGDFVAGWWKATESPVVEGYIPQIYSGTQYVYARVYSITGKPKTLPIRVDGGRATKSWFSKPLTGYWAGPLAVGMDGPGNFTVAWFGQQFSGPDTSFQTVKLQSFSAAGTALSPATPIYQSAEWVLPYVSLAMNRAGQYAVSWSCRNQSGNPVCAQSFQPGNVAASSVLNVFGNPPSPSWYYTSTPTVAIDAGGDFIVGAFADVCSDSLPCSYTPAIRLFAFDGTARSGDVVFPSEYPDSEISPGVAMDANGDAAVLYIGPRTGELSNSAVLQRVSGH